MDDVIESAIARMRRDLGDEITIDGLAKVAMFSRFHFTRLFQRATGTSPSRFLMMIRLEEAKRLLLDTTQTVTEISYRVGYNSVGTFTSRFKASVGMTPTAFRRGSDVMAAYCRMEHRAPPEAGSTVFAEIRGPSAPTRVEDSPVFVGMFDKASPEGLPVRAAVLDRPGPLRLDNPPPGSWYLLALSQAGPTTLVGSFGPFDLHEGAAVRARIDLRPLRSTDQPILLALPGGTG